MASDLYGLDLLVAYACTLRSVHRWSRFIHIVGMREDERVLDGVRPHLLKR